MSPAPKTTSKGFSMLPNGIFDLLEGGLIDSNDLAVFAIMKFLAKSRTYCDASTGQIAEKLNKSKATVLRALDRLEAVGAIRRDRDVNRGATTSKTDIASARKELLLTPDLDGEPKDAPPIAPVQCPPSRPCNAPHPKGAMGASQGSNGGIAPVQCPPIAPARSSEYGSEGKKVEEVEEVVVEAQDDHDNERASIVQFPESIPEPEPGAPLIEVIGWIRGGGKRAAVARAASEMKAFLGDGDEHDARHQGNFRKIGRGDDAVMQKVLEGYLAARHAKPSDPRGVAFGMAFVACEPEDDPEIVAVDVQALLDRHRELDRADAEKQAAEAERRRLAEATRQAAEKQAAEDAAKRAAEAERRRLEDAELARKHRERRDRLYSLALNDQMTAEDIYLSVLEAGSVLFFRTLSSKERRLFLQEQVDLSGLNPEAQEVILRNRPKFEAYLKQFRVDSSYAASSRLETA